MIISNPNIIHERAAFFKLKNKIEEKDHKKSLIEKNYLKYIDLKAGIH
jgi:hypothetical protein